MLRPFATTPQRRWASIAVKFVLICLSFAIPLGVLKNYIGTRQEAIDFGSKELEGDAFQRPRKGASRGFSTPRRTAYCRGRGRPLPAINAAKSDGDRAMKELTESFAIHGESRHRHHRRLGDREEERLHARKRSKVVDRGQRLWWHVGRP